MEAFLHNWRIVQERIARVADQIGRDPGEIAVVAVTKNRSPEEVEIAFQNGIQIVGENRVQEAEAKKAQVRVSGQWHLIGHLQTNKAKKAVALFDMVQSVDSFKVAEVLDQQAARAARILEVLVQVNTSGATTQFGVAPEALRPLVEQVALLPHLRLRGLMTIGALSEDQEVVRSSFRRLRQLRETLAAACLPGVDLTYLSMGMSGDFELAIAEGANMVRLGTVLFGPRPA